MCFDKLTNLNKDLIKYNTELKECIRDLLKSKGGAYYSGGSFWHEFLVKSEDIDKLESLLYNKED